MNSYRLSRESIRILAFAAALAAGAPFAVAQTATPAASGGSAPVQLLPTAPVPVEPLPDEAPVPAETDTATADTRAPSGIEVEAITSADGYGGTLDPENGGLGIDMWQGTDRAAAEALLPELPAPGGSPALRDLVRRLLLSSAEAPLGEAGRSLLGLRAERLRALGNLADMKAFLAVLPQRPEDEAIARFRLETGWLADDLETACAEAGALLPQFPDAVDLQEAQVFCQALAGQTKESALGASLLREQGVNDRTFVTLLRAVNGEKGVRLSEEDGPPSALLLAMAKKGGVEAPPVWGDSDDPAILARLAADPALPFEARLSVGERAFAMGALEVEALQAIYRSAEVPQQRFAELLTLEDEALTAESRALFFQAIERAQKPADRARLLHRLLELSRARGGYPAAVATEMTVLLQLEPTADLAWFAADAGRAFYLAGRYERAGAWENIARLRSQNDADAAEAVRTLALLGQIAGGAEPLQWSPDAVEQWRLQQEAAGDPDATMRAARLFAVLAALGEPVGDRWTTLAGEPLAVAPHHREQIAAAAAAGRRAETLALAAILIGPRGTAAVHPVLLNEALAALKQAGLDAEARALAVETVIANGI